jgi:VIT1/CCC1 family predicted Fe2+/Mn2+ transporter
MAIKDLMKRWKKYATMSDLGIIARRKFFNNCFDGALTCAGIVSGLFIVFLHQSGVENTPSTVIIYGFATALAIGISGLWGAFLSEEAERKKKMTDLRKIMEENLNSNEEDLQTEQELADIQKAMIFPLKKGITPKKEKLSDKVRGKKKEKSIIQQSEDFATWVASLVDGFAPVLGSSLPLIPFFFGTSLTLFHFLFSYAILAGLLIYLGIFLGNISGGGKTKYSIHLITAGIVTLLVSALLGL